MEILYENKKRESKINEAIDDTKKLNVNISEEKSKDNLNENEIKNLIINIDYPPFKPSTLNNKKEDIKKDIKKSNIIPKSSSNTIFEANTNDNIRNEDYEYLIEMFGKKGWVCLLCNNFNYEKRIKCNRCGQLKKPKKISNLKLKMKKIKTNKKIIIKVIIKIKIGFAVIAKISIILSEIFATDAKSQKLPKLYIILIQVLIIISNVIMPHFQLNLFFLSIILKTFI